MMPAMVMSGLDEDASLRRSLAAHLVALETLCAQERSAAELDSRESEMIHRLTFAREFSISLAESSKLAAAVEDDLSALRDSLQQWYYAMTERYDSCQRTASARIQLLTRRIDDSRVTLDQSAQRIVPTAQRVSRDRWAPRTVAFLEALACADQAPLNKAPRGDPTGVAFLSELSVACTALRLGFKVAAVDGHVLGSAADREDRQCIAAAIAGMCE